jgi:hypothetical protein
MMDIFLTLDYELFMGGVTGSPLNSLIKPMRKLTAVAEKYGAKFIVFVDAAYLLRLKALSDRYENLKDDYILVSQHIKELEQSGHDVELHFHPQWLYSTYNGEKWEMDLAHYKFSDMPENDVNAYFTEAKELLDSLIGRKTIAFRAGGYSLNTYNNYTELFRKNGIIIDSSVNGRSKVVSRYQSYDYSHTPKKGFWRFTNDISKVDEHGDFMEYRISTTKTYPGLQYLLKKRQLHKSFGNHKSFGDGVSIDAYMPPLERLIEQITKFIKGKNFAASIDGLMSSNLNNIYRTLLKSNANEMVVIGHPKNASEESIKNFELFLELVHSEVNFRTFKSIKNENCIYT